MFQNENATPNLTSMKASCVVKGIVFVSLLSWTFVLAQGERIAIAQNPAPPSAHGTGVALAPVSVPLGVPKPGPTNDAPYAPQPILPGGVVIPLYSADSPFLKTERVREAEQYNMSKSVPGRISSIVKDRKSTRLNSSH